MERRKKYKCKHIISIRTVRKRAIQSGEKILDPASNHNKRKMRKNTICRIFDRLYKREIFEGINKDLEYFINDLNGEKSCLKKV